MDLTSFLALSTLLSAAFGYVGQVFSDSGIRVYFFDLMLLSCLLWAVRTGKIFSLGLDKRRLPWGIFMGALALSFGLNLWGKETRDVLVAGMYLVRVLALMAMSLVFIEMDRERLRGFFLMALFVFVALGIGQYIFFPDTRDLALLGFDDHYYRMIGSLLDPNFSGLVFSFGVLYFLNRNKPLLVLLFLFCVALTFSRSSFLALGVGFLVYLFASRRWTSLVFVPIFLLFVMTTPKPFGEGVNLGRTYSIVARIENSQEVVSQGISNWVYGEGYNFVASNKERVSVKGFENRGGGIDNSFLLVLTSSGIVGVTSLLYLIWKVGREYRESVLIMSSGASLIVHSLTNNSLFFVPVIVFFMAMLAFERKQEKSGM